MKDAPRPLVSELAKALRDAPPAADAVTVRSRVLARLEASIAAPVPAKSRLTARPGPRVRALPRVAAQWLVPAFLAGAAAGVWIDRAVVSRGTAPPAPLLAVTVPTEAPTGAFPRERATEPTASAPPPESVGAPRPRAPAAASSVDPSMSLAAEQALLDAARTALARGEPAQALAPLGHHAARFPSGRLTEEREALAVRVLAALDRDGDAKRRAALFHQRFPGSLFSPAVDAALTSMTRRNDDSAPKP